MRNMVNETSVLLEGLDIINALLVCEQIYHIKRGLWMTA